MNRDDVDGERFVGAVVLLLGLAFLDAPTTPLDYAFGSLLLLGALAFALDPIREERAFRVVAATVFLGVAAVRFVGAMDAQNFVTAFGFDGLFALLLVADLLGSEYRRRNPLPE